MTKTANDILNENLALNHELVLIIAFNKNGKIHIDTNRPTYEFVNYAINRAEYNINHLETTEVLQKEMTTQSVDGTPSVSNAEQTVQQMVAENTTPKKRGRPAKVKV